MGGITNPFIQEVVIATDKYPESIAHEKSHLVGFAREDDAQFMGYMSMHRSTNSYLKYLAYMQRLDMLLDNSDEFEDTEDPLVRLYAKISKLHGLGLNAVTLDEITSREMALIEERERASRYQKLKNNFMHGARSLMLKCAGQGDIDNAYLEEPLKMISAYYPPV